MITYDENRVRQLMELLDNEMPLDDYSGEEPIHAWLRERADKGDSMPAEVFRGLQQVRLNRKELLEKLRVNRDGHRVIFEEALEGWHAAVIETLTSMLKDAKSGKKYTPFYSLPEPQDHTREYDRVIGMLESSLDEELVITHQEYAQYALDDWGWKDDFLNSSANYGSVTATRSLMGT